MRIETYPFKANVHVTINDENEGMHVLYLSGTTIDEVKRLLTNYVDDGK